MLLAKLFAKPANVIVLDEPTNDLDAETLELLEERLVEFAGTVLLVSHDRAFLNNVVTSTIVFEAGRREGIRRRLRRLAPATAEAGRGPSRLRAAAAATESRKSKEADPRKRRLTFKEKQELQTADDERSSGWRRTSPNLHAEMAKPEFYQQPGDQIAAETARLKSLEDQLAAAFARWEELAPLAD